MTKNEVIELISTAIDSLTWERLAMVVTIATFGIGMAFMFDSREQLIDRAFGRVEVSPIEGPFIVSPESRKEIQGLVDTQPLIGGTIVWDVDLKKNRASTIFTYPKELVITNAELSLPQAFFDTDTKSRDQAIAVISNSFTCTTSESVTFTRTLTQFPISCYLAIPPYSGGFAGFMALALTRQPTGSEQDALRIELTRIAISIYLRDVENKGIVKPKN